MRLSVVNMRTENGDQGENKNFEEDGEELARGWGMVGAKLLSSSWEERLLAEVEWLRSVTRQEGKEKFVEENDKELLKS